MPRLFLLGVSSTPFALCCAQVECSSQARFAAHTHLFIAIDIALGSGLGISSVFSAGTGGSDARCAGTPDAASRVGTESGLPVGRGNPAVSRHSAHFPAPALVTARIAARLGGLGRDCPQPHSRRSRDPFGWRRVVGRSANCSARIVATGRTLAAGGLFIGACRHDPAGLRGRPNRIYRALAVMASCAAASACVSLRMVHRGQRHRRVVGSSGTAGRGGVAVRMDMGAHRLRTLAPTGNPQLHGVARLGLFARHRTFFSVECLGLASGRLRLYGGALRGSSSR